MDPGLQAQLLLRHAFLGAEPAERDAKTDEKLGRFGHFLEGRTLTV